MSIQSLSKSIQNQRIFTNCGEAGALAVIAFNQNARKFSNVGTAKMYVRFENRLRCRQSTSISKIFAFEIQMSKSLFSRNKHVNWNSNIFQRTLACLPSRETFFYG